MNKSELVSSVARSSGLPRGDAEAAIDAFVETIMTEVKSGRRVSLVGFGTFNPTSRRARTGRNPQTGEPVRIAASKGVRFAAGSSFKASLNGRPVPKKARKKKAAAKRSPARRKATASRATAKRAPARKKSTAKRAPARKRSTAAKATKKRTASRRRSTGRR